MWKQLKVKDYQYCINQQVTMDYMITMFSNFCFISEEVLPITEAISRFKNCNPSIQESDDTILEFLKSLLDEENADLAVKEKDDIITLKVTKNMSGKNYFFELTRKPEDSVFREITLPLLLLVQELKYRQEILYKKLEAKDVEILEYRLDGFKITRKNVITSRFQREEFEKESNCEVEKRLKEGVTNTAEIFEKNMNEFHPLYKNVVSTLPTDLLKKGKIPEEMKEKPVAKVDEVKAPPKRKYATETNVPIKRTIVKKRII